MFLHQAIYTSCQTARADGYQLAVTSVGIAEDDLRELALRGPSHDSLWEAGPAAVSVNFHPLPSGAYCISQTTPAGGEYSLRRGPQVYTQSLIVEANDLAEFGNNPFALLQSAIALGQVAVLEKIPKRLDPIWLEVEPHCESGEALAQLVRHPGPVWLGRLLDCALTSASLGIVAGERGAGLVSALVQCLPCGCRSEFSFTTGLRFSPRRPYRVLCLPNSHAENQRLVRQQQLVLFEPKGPPPEPTQLGGWASFITAAVASGNTEYLAAELARPREGLTVASLNQLGDQLAQGLHDLDASQAPRHPPTSARPAAVLEQVDPWARADSPHRGVSLIAAQATALEPSPAGPESHFQIEEEPAQTIGASCPAALNQLRHLEDLIFDTMAGKDVTNELTALWPQILQQIGEERIEATREQFLRFTLALWRQLNSSGGLNEPQRAVQAMQVICLLFASK